MDMYQRAGLTAQVPIIQPAQKQYQYTKNTKQTKQKQYDNTGWSKSLCAPDDYNTDSYK